MKYEYNQLCKFRKKQKLKKLISNAFQIVQERKKMQHRELKDTGKVPKDMVDQIIKNEEI